jgi:hypothetical protein
MSSKRKSPIKGKRWYGPQTTQEKCCTLILKKREYFSTAFAPSAGACFRVSKERRKIN